MHAERRKEMFESERIHYKKLCNSDFDFFNHLYSNEKVMQYTYADAFTSDEKAYAKFQRCLQLQEQEETEVSYIAESKDTGDKIGITNFELYVNRIEGSICEIGYFILPEYWGRGYASEMSQAITTFLFEQYHAQKVLASCHADNLASQKVMRKLGMSMEGNFRKSRYKNGTWADELKFGILREEWNIRITD